MNLSPRYLSVFYAVICIFLQTTAYTEPENLALLRDKLIRYHDSGAYGLETKAIINAAERYINKRIYVNKHKTHPQKLAVVFDIDETLLSNYKQMSARNFVATHQQLKHDVIAENATAIQPSLFLYKYSLRQGIAVFFITGRHDYEKTHTIHNLRKEGFTRWQGIYFKPDDYNKSSAISYKMSARAAISRKGYTIIANIGDQCSDLRGGYSEATFKLPNPYYFIP